MKASHPVAAEAVMSRYLTVAEEKQLFKTVRAAAGVLPRRDAAFMGLLRETGMRVGTLACLTVTDARRSAGIGGVGVQTFPDYYYKRVRTGALASEDKTLSKHKTYPIHFNVKARAYLQELLKIRTEMKFGVLTGDEPLIMNHRGHGLSIRAIQHRVAHWRKQAGLHDLITPHAFRHTKAMRILSNSTATDGKALTILASGLGNSLAAVRSYTLPTREDVAEAWGNS